MFVAIASHEEKSIVLPDGNVALQRDCLTVKPRYRPALAIIAPPISGTLLFVLHFPLLDWLFTDGRCETSLHNRISRRTLPCANFAPRLRALHCNCVVCICARARLHGVWQIYGRSKPENGRKKLIVLGQIVHALFISNFILCYENSIFM